jgi:hypothetical protein
MAQPQQAPLPALPIATVGAALAQIVDDKGGVSNSRGVSNREIGKLLRQKLNVNDFEPTQCGPEFNTLRKIAAVATGVRIENRGRLWFLVHNDAPQKPYEPRPRNFSNSGNNNNNGGANFNNGANNNGAEGERRPRRPRRRGPRREGGAPQQPREPQAPRAPREPRAPRAPREFVVSHPVRTLSETANTLVELFPSIIQATSKTSGDAQSLLALNDSAKLAFLHDISAAIAATGLTGTSLQFDHGSRNRRTPAVNAVVCRITTDRAQFQEKFPAPAAPQQA